MIGDIVRIVSVGDVAPVINRVGDGAYALNRIDIDVVLCVIIRELEIEIEQTSLL